MHYSLYKLEPAASSPSTGKDPYHECMKPFLTHDDIFFIADNIFFFPPKKFLNMVCHFYSDWVGPVHLLQMLNAASCVQQCGHGNQPRGRINRSYAALQKVQRLSNAGEGKGAEAKKMLMFTSLLPLPVIKGSRTSKHYLSLLKLIFCYKVTFHRATVLLH